MIVAMTTGEIVTLIGAVAAAVVSIIGAWRVNNVKNEVAGVKQELKTSNELTLGQLGANTETRRIEEIPFQDRTAQEDRHIVQSAEANIVQQAKDIQAHEKP